MIDSSCKREQKNGERGSGDVGQVKVFTFFFLREMILRHFINQWVERGEKCCKRESGWL